MHCVVIGGGIAGVSCAQQLRESGVADAVRVTLVAASPTVKIARNVKTLSRARVTFDVVEENRQVLAEQGIAFVHGEVVAIDTDKQVVQVRDDAADVRLVPYDKLCVASGAVPRLVSEHPSVIGVRDTESVQDLAKRIEHASRICVVGNGAVALEVIHAVRSIPLVWVIRNDTMGSSYFDEGAAQFFIDSLGHMNRSDGSKKRRLSEERKDTQPPKQPPQPPKQPPHGARKPVQGASLGPHWATALRAKQIDDLGKTSEQSALRLVSDADVIKIESTDDEGKAGVILSTGETIVCDVVVSAIGVEPFVPFVPASIARSPEDGGILVDRHFLTSTPNVYAAGDVCHASWATSSTWFQMRLWSQARVMGIEAGLSMLHGSEWIDNNSLSFELFAHVTSFFGFKVVLLGLYNGQTLGDEYTVNVRCTPGEEYIKIVLKDHRAVGAVLIGDTDLEETFENLILNATDLSLIEGNLLDPDVDLEDYFD